MINIAKITNPKYLFEHSKHEYYTEGDNEKGFFTGSGSRYMKSEGKEVSQKQFEYLVGLGGKDNQGVEIDPGAPKDWSILYNRVSDEDREKMDKAFKEALIETAKAIEENTYYRKTENGKEEYVLARGVSMAIFQHHTSRSVKDKAVDCHEHGHIIVFPKVLGRDGKMYSHTLYDLINEKDGQGNKQTTLKYLDQVFQHSLAKFLTNEMGYTVSRGVKDSFRIDGISDDLRKEFSQRTESIKEMAKEGADYSELKKLSLQQRNSKSENDLSVLREQWHERMKDRNFDISSVQSMKGKQVNLDKSFEEAFKGYKFITEKQLKLMALSESKFSTKTYQEKLDEFKGSEKLQQLKKGFYLHKSNKSMEKLGNQYRQHKKIEFVKSLKNRNIPIQKQANHSKGVQKPTNNRVADSTPAPSQSKLAKDTKAVSGKQSDKILSQLNELASSHALRMVQILSQTEGKPGTEGQAIAKEISNYQQQHSQLMDAYREALQQENKQSIEI
ncbi:relaxase domain-containing protein [Burkholderia contaminans]|mgnify:CR=1 FL=1|jgi:conjugative relaxase-like TrwC/TraI family protein|uniref:MobF family relaxase n=2 Tax=Burkholderiales TaxID=80840 RepID=UPI00158BCDA5|nr:MULTISPECIES: MobF family relaxase [Burkholderiaceae]MBH9720238.1 relaxase domain-containing protein [Burkholderia contaminans]MBR8013448.1 relaxase domain-containing protein [Burkholderia vietnamiensis]HDR9039772.1 relaxase domain-containing protein [Burkholderia vietnamiensis]HDR9196449.1 relaxase domain-containing protein [Burkholderia vietnamiensis]